MANSFTGEIKTNGEFVKVSEAADFIFTEGVTYTMQAHRGAYIKISDAVFHVETSEKFQFKAGSDDLYIKTHNSGCTLTILENE